MRAGLVVLVVLVAGCAQPAECFDIPASAMLGAPYDGTVADADLALRELGWTTDDGRTYRGVVAGTHRTLAFSASPQTDGILFLNVLARGFASDVTLDATRADLGPVLEPLRDRFGGDVHYTSGHVGCPA